ncbi:MFS transporter [Marichromatium gracile]|uniref:MFS transporter n=1 Tax=Marichromatium gracile TaxID=1048 RepID=UPI0009ED6A62|nr:MFS transporter [Marichromatium gracile]
MHSQRLEDERRPLAAAAPARDATLAVASAATALVLIVFTLPLTTLTATAQALGAGPGGQAWILSAMSVGAASGLLGSGAVGDDYGRRRTFLAGTLLLALASVLGALAPNALVLILARVVQGLGGAAVLACSLGLIGHAYSGRALARATAIWGGALGAGVAVGPILAAQLAALGGWSGPYWFAAVAALVLTVSGRLLLGESVAARPRPVDIAGTFLLGLGMAALLAGFTQTRTGWDQPSVYGLVIAGVALLAGFVVVERRLANPMLDLALFRRPDFTGAILAALASGAGVLTLMSLIPVILERAMGVDTMTTAWVLLAWSATSSVAAIAARWLTLTPRQLLIGGLLGCALGQLSVYGLDADSSVLRLLPGMLLAGAANGVLNAALGRQAVASVPADRSAMGSGANNTARYLGSATGLTLCTLIVTHAGGGSEADAVLAGWNGAVLVTVGCSLLGALAVFLARAPAHGRVPAEA